MTMPTQPLLEVKNLIVSVPHAEAAHHLVDGISFSITRGETFGIVGESGSGKTMTALSLMRLVPYPLTMQAGVLRFDEHDLLALDDAALRAVRGRHIAIVAQDPSSAFNPVFTVGTQLVEAVLAHTPQASRTHAQKRALEFFRRVHIPHPERIFYSYPHQLSGGTKQRALIAMALVNEPELLILDEPTTALDVTVQAQILDLLDEIKERMHVTILCISHDFGVIGRMCDTVAVMKAGRIVETGRTHEILHEPHNLYTKTLLESVKALV